MLGAQRTYPQQSHAQEMEWKTSGMGHSEMKWKTRPMLGAQRIYHTL
jgi:hypothetical protein